MASPEDDDDLIPDSGAVFTFGRSRFADNLANKFWIKNDPVLQVSCGDEHSAVVTERGRVYVFGSNDWGQLGLNHKKASSKPSFLKVLKPEKILQVACGRSHTLVYAESEKLYSFGGDEDGQLGHGDRQNEISPKSIEELETLTIKQISCGAYHSVALTDDGQVYVWGNNSEGQIGLGPDQTEALSPVLLSFDDDDDEIISISCGYYHTACVSRNGNVYTFGEDETGKLGLEGSQLNDTTLPQAIATLDNDHYIQVSCGARHTVAITKKGRCYSWGDGGHGQLGHGTMCQEVATPKMIESLSTYKIVNVSCGDSHTAVVTDKGKIFTFGDGRHGKLGQGDECFSNLFKPTLIKRFKGFHVDSVSCGGCHMLVRAVRLNDEDIEDDEEDENESLMSSMRSEKSIKEANMTLKPGNTFPIVSPRDKRRQKETEEGLSKSVNLNGSLNTSFNMAQLNRRDLPQLPSSLDKNRLPKIPGMDLGKKKLEPVDKLPKRNIDTGEPVERDDEDVSLKKNKRLVAEISFSRKPEPRPLKKPVPSPRGRANKSENIMNKLDINENLEEETKKPESDDETSNYRNVIDKKNKKNLRKKSDDNDDDSTYASQNDEISDDAERTPKLSSKKQVNKSKQRNTTKKENLSEDDEEEEEDSGDEILRRYKNKMKDKNIDKKTAKDSEDESENESDEDDDSRKKTKQTKPKPAPRKLQQVKQKNDEDDDEDDDDEEDDETEEEETEDEEEEVPIKKSKNKSVEKSKQKTSHKTTKRTRLVEEESEEDEEEDDEETEEEDEDDEEILRKKKKVLNNKKALKEKAKKKKKKQQHEDDDDDDEDEDEEDDDEYDEVDGKKKKNKKKEKSSKKKKGKNKDDEDEEDEEDEDDDEDDDDEDDEEEDEVDSKKNKKKGKKEKETKKKMKKKDDEEDEEEEDDEDDADDGEKKSETKKDEEEKSGFFSFFRRKKKPVVSKEENNSSGSKPTSPVPDQQESKTCTIL